MSKGKSLKIKNIHFKGSKSLITAVTSNGDWFYSWLSCTNNSDTFFFYVKDYEMSGCWSWIWIKLVSHYDR